MSCFLTVTYHNKTNTKTTFKHYQGCKHFNSKTKMPDMKSLSLPVITAILRIKTLKLPDLSNIHLSRQMSHRQVSSVTSLYSYRSIPVMTYKRHAKLKLNKSMQN